MTIRKNIDSVPIRIEHKDGWYIATSDTLPLVLASRNKEEILEDLPRAVRLLIKQMRNKNGIEK